MQIKNKDEVAAITFFYHKAVDDGMITVPIGRYLCEQIDKIRKVTTNKRAFKFWQSGFVAVGQSKENKDEVLFIDVDKKENGKYGAIFELVGDRSSLYHIYICLREFFGEGLPAEYKKYLSRKIKQEAKK